MIKKLKRAFTITELVIVIAVIAILAAVLIPTFSNVVQSSKVSADNATIKELNVALYNYEVQNDGALEMDEYYSNAEEVYYNVCKAFDDAGYSDESNMFLLACDIKQDSKYLIWYYESNTVGLIDDISSSLFNTTIAPNFYRVNTSDSSTWGMLLSNNASGDYGAFASYYNNESTVAELVASNSTWGAAVTQYLKNEEAGLTTATANTSWATSDLSDGDSVTFQATTSEAAVKYLAGVLTVVQSGTSLKGVTITYETAVDMDLTGTTWTPISDVHRDGASTTTTLQGSIDFGDSTITGLTIDNDYVSTSAQYQDEDDNGYKGGGYNITYGLFGTLNGLESTVVISNLTMTDCCVKLNGVTTSVGGTSTDTISDSAGLLAGYAVGDVTIKNVNIGSSDSPCYIEGYDAVGGLVGRYYGYNKGEEDSTERTFTIDNCNVYCNVYGERRSGGLVGVVSNDKYGNVVIKDTTYQGLVYCDGELADADQYGALVGGYIVTSKSLTISDVTVTAFVVAKNIDASGSTIVYDPNSLVALYGGSTSQIHKGDIKVSNLVVNQAECYYVTGTTSKEYFLGTLQGVGSESYSSLLPCMIVSAVSGGSSYTYTGTFNVDTVNRNAASNTYSAGTIVATYTPSN